MAVNTNTNHIIDYWSCSHIIVWNSKIKRTVWLDCCCSLSLRSSQQSVLWSCWSEPTSLWSPPSNTWSSRMLRHRYTQMKLGFWVHYVLFFRSYLVFMFFSYVYWIWALIKCTGYHHRHDCDLSWRLMQPWAVIFSISSNFHGILQVDHSPLPSSPGSSDDLSRAWSRWPVLDPLVDHPHSCPGRHPVADSTGLHTVEGNTCTLYTPSIAYTFLPYVLSHKTDIYMNICVKKYWNIQDGTLIWTLVPH